jgi:uncharacterized protein (TIGR00661 family)
MNGFTIQYNESGRADYIKTFYNLKFIQFLKDIKLDLSEYDKIITDFEPITGWAAKLKEKECIGLSNQCSFLSDKTPRPNNKNLLGEFILKNMVPVTKPIGLHFEKYDSFIHTPIIKETMKLLDTTDMGFYLVYLPTYHIETIISRLSIYPNTKFEVFHPNQSNYRIRNIHVRNIHPELFQENLRHSHGVITSAGFQTTTETLYLKKRLYCIPIKGQYEQECNAIALSNLGVETGSLEKLGSFLKSENLPKINWEDSTDNIINIILSH